VTTQSNSGLVLVLIACLVGAITTGLMSAKANEIVHVTAASPVPPQRQEQRQELLAEATHPLLPPILTGLDDELLASPMLRDPEFGAEVERWVHFWATKRTEWFPGYLARMTWFEEIVDTTLAAHGLPWSLRYLPVIESGYSPSAVSSASAVGLWQLMSATAQDLGVEVTRFVDDRRDPFESTAAAADFLVDLRAEFGSWFLALAAYNAGPERIRGILRRHARNATRSDSLYWAIRYDLPRETREFVPNLIGAMIVASDPEAHGYDVPEPQPFEFDRVPVRGAFTFEGLAQATGAKREEIARLNPAYIRGVTPDRRRVDVRVPLGQGQSMRDYYASGGRRSGQRAGDGK